MVLNLCYVKAVNEKCLSLCYDTNVETNAQTKEVFFLPNLGPQGLLSRSHSLHLTLTVCLTHCESLAMDLFPTLK